jgi:hypothetical protein
LNVVETKVLRVFLLAIQQSPLPKVLRVFLLAIQQSPLLTDFTPPNSLSKSDLKLVCNVNIVYGNLKSENSQDYAQKPQRSYTFMNSAFGRTLLLKSLRNNSSQQIVII